MRKKINIEMLIILCYVVYYIQTANSSLIETVLEEDKSVSNLMGFYIPIVNSKNEKCRNHSLFYLEDLKKHKLWATEMFDASTKFPSGILHGSAYDFGNFDECMELRVSYQNTNFFGKYCMVKFTIHSPNMDHGIGLNNYSNYEYADYEKSYNISVWEKVEYYLNKRTKRPRNEMYFSFCVPSTCSKEDLRLALEDYIIKINEKSDFKIEVNINENACQINESTKLDAGDIIFMLIITVSIINVILATIYDKMTQKDDYMKYKLAGKLHKAILCFSIPQNFKRIVSTKTNPDGLNCLSGMKVYSMFLIILLHRNMFDYGSALVNPKHAEKVFSTFALTFILNGPILVDTFFTISGFLATYIILCEYHKSKNGVNLLYLYVHRYVRLTSTYWIILMFYCTLFVKLGDGPMWQQKIGVEREKCRHAWWANMLYVNNYVLTEYYCMFQSWYMACDMNCFLLVPILCWILWKKASAGVLTVIVIIIASVVAVFITVFVNDENPFLVLSFKVMEATHADSTFLKIYIPGHLRAAPYFVGVLTGFLKYKMKINDWKIQKTWVRLGWLFSVVLMFSALHVAFAFYIKKQHILFSSIFAPLHHFAWSLGVAWLIIVVSSGYEPRVYRILSWKPLLVLSRITYTVYLCHGAIQLYSAGTIRNPVYASDFNTVHKTVADIVLANILAFVLTILFESPIIGLEKTILKKEKSEGRDINKNEMVSVTELPTA